MSTHRTVLVIAESDERDNDYEHQLQQDRSIAYKTITQQHNTLILAISQLQQIDGILLELYPHSDGIKLLRQLKEQMGDSCPPIVVIDGGNPEIAVQALKNGAVDYLVKDRFTPDDLRLAMRNAIENADLRRKLQCSQEQFQTSVENMLDCFGIFSALRDESGQIVDFRIDYLNAAACENNRIPKAMQLGRGLCEIFPAHRETGLFNEYCRVVETGEPLIKDSLIYDDTFGDRQLIRVFDIRATKLNNGFVASWRDVTARRQMELELSQTVAALQTSQQRYRELAEAMPQIVWTADTTGAVNYWNQRWYEYTGLSEAEAMSLAANTIHPDDRERTLAQWSQSIAHGETFEVEYRLRRWDGEYHWFISRAIPTPDNEEQITGWIGTITDIDNQKRLEANLLSEIDNHRRTEQELRRGEERLRLAQLAADAGHWDWEVGTNRVFWSTEYYTLYGLDPAIPSSYENWLASILEIDRERVDQEVRSALANKQREVYIEYRIHHPIRGVRWLLAKGQTRFNAAGQPEGMTGFTFDITARKQAEIALREKEQQLQQLSDSMPQFVWMCSATGRLEYVNRQWFEYSGLTLEKTCAVTPWEFFHPDDVQLMIDHWTIAQETKQRFEMEARLRRAWDGAYRWFLIRAIPGFDQQEQMLRWYGTSTDIHDHKQAQLDEQFLNELDLRLRQLSDADAMVWEVVSSLGAYLNVDRCLWQKVNLPEDLMIVEQDWRRQDVPSLVGVYRLSEFVLPDLLNLCHAGQTVVVSDVTTNPYTAPFAERYIPTGTRAFVTVPCVYEGRCVAVLAANSSVVRNWQSDEIALLQETVARLWSLIEQTRTIQALRESEERFRTLADNISQFAWMADENGWIIWYNRRWFEYTGTTLAEMEGWGWQKVHHPEHVERVVKKFRHCVETGETWEDTFPLRGKDGEYRWFLSRAIPVRNEQGKVLRWFGTNTDITERKRIEAALRESEELKQRILESSSDCIKVLTLEGQILYINTGGLSIIEADDPTSILDTNWVSFWHEDQERAKMAIAAAKAGNIGRFQGYCPTLRGKPKWWDVVTTPLRDASGQVVKLVVTSRDITEQKQAEATLSHSEQRYRSLTEATAQIIWDVQSAQGEFVTEQPGWSAFTGQTFDELKGWGWLNAVHPDDRATTTQAWLTALANRTLYEVEHRLRRHDGTYRYMNVRAVPVFEEDDTIREWIGVHTDVTDRKQAEAALRQSEDRLRMAIESAQLGTWDWNLITNKLTWDVGCKAMFGLPPDAQSSIEVFFEGLHPDDRHRLEQVVQWSLNPASGGNYDVEYRTLGIQDGVERWIAAKGQVYFDAAGNPLRFVGTVMDITARKQAESARRESETRFRTLASHAPVGIFMTDASGNCLYVNERWCEMAGMSLESAQGKGWVSAVHPDDRERIAEVWYRASQNGQIFAAEYRFQTPQGKVTWIQGSATALQRETGEVAGYLGTLTDITERKQAEAEREHLFQQEQAAREAAERANRIKDEFLAVLSHELRSPLNPILGWTQLLQARKLDETKTAQALATIERNAKLQTQLIDDLLDVAKILRGKLSLNATSVNLSFVIAAATETVRTAAAAKFISLNTILPNVGQVSGDAARLQQIIWNLLSNAIKFTPNGGRVDIQLERLGNQAQITVRDTGKGISPNFLPHIFESFRQEDASITRKYGGLGLGLAIVRQLVEAHGGTIIADSPGEGLGATFTVQLPLLNIEPEIKQLDALPEQSFDITGIRVLAVDDDPDARELLTVLLTQYGAEVLTVTSASEVLANLESFQPDVLISDIGMPEVDGYSLIQQVRALPPAKGGQLPAIALTAYARVDDYHRAIISGYQQHVTKPLEPERLVQAVITLTWSTKLTP